MSFYMKGDENLEGIIDNLENALNTWSAQLAEIWSLLTQDPENFRGGNIWKIIVQIHGSLKAIGLALLVLFFLYGLVKETTSLRDIKRPEMGLKLFLRFVIARALVVYGMEFMTSLFRISQGIISNIVSAVGISSAPSATLPQEIIDAVKDASFLESIPLWAVTLLGSVFITILSFAMILTVYGRFFKLYMYAAISPIPLAAAASESTQNIPISFMKSYVGVCLEGALIVLACVIFSAFSSSPPTVRTGASAVSMVWSYIGELIFNMLILVGTVRLSDRLVKEMMGL